MSSLRLAGGGSIAYGRRTRLQPEFIAEFAQHITDGVMPMTACQMMGVNDSMYYQWMADGRANRAQPCIDFERAVEKAKAACMKRRIGIIEHAAERTWQAAAWLLERSHPEMYALRNRLEVSHPEPMRVEVKQIEPDVDRIAAILTVLAGVGIVPTEGEIAAISTNYQP